MVDERGADEVAPTADACLVEDGLAVLLHTGKPFAVEMGIFWTLGPEDLITEERAHFDATGMLTQLGLVP